MTPAAALQSTKPRDALIVAHFHRDGIIRDDTIDALTLMQSCFERILLVSTNLMKDESRKLPATVELIVRDNIGYDFYSYREGISRLRATPGQWRITLMNTSFVITDAERLIREFVLNGVQGQDFDCLGLTKSIEIKEHLQSFLLSFSSRLVADPRFAAWWQDMMPLDERQKVIESYEVGLSAAVASWGYVLHSLFKAEGLVQTFNPTHFCYPQLLDQYGIVKIQVFRSNPCGLPLLPLITRAEASPRFMHLLKGGYGN